MLQVCFDCYGTYTTDSVYQWDLNRRLAIRGLDYNSAPAIHFSNKKSTEALVVQSTIEDGVIYCDVPNILLQEPYDIVGYVCECLDQELTTYETIRIPVKSRVKPADYAYEDNVEILTYYALMSEITSVKASTERTFNSMDASKASKSELSAVKVEAKNNLDTEIAKVENEIASERARIDQLVASPEMAEGDFEKEVEDLRIDTEGTTHGSAGTAVRSQLQALDSKIGANTNRLSSEIAELAEVVGGIPTVNMFDKDKSSVGQITTSGAVNTDSNYYTSELFTIDKSKTYSVSDNGERIAIMTDSAYICKDFGFNLVNSLEWVKHENGMYIFDFSNGGITQSPIYIKASVHKNNANDFWIIEGDKIVVNKIAELEKDVANLMENESYNPNRVVCVGDSQTGGTNGNSYPTLLKNNHLSNYEVVNFGNGGELVTEIAWRCGALPLYINPFTLPTDTSKVSITKKLANNRMIDKLFVAWNNANPVNVGGVDCYISSSGTIQRVESGANSITFDRPILAVPPLPLNKDNCTHVLLFGQNGGFSSIDDYIALAKSIIDCMPNDKYIIIPPFTKSFMSLLDNMTYDDFLGVMYNHFGVHVFDLRNYLVNYGLVDNGLTATETDNTAIANGEVPPQLYDDMDLHMNVYGLTSHAKGLYLYGKDLGYWS